MEKYQPDVADDVISGLAVEQVGVDVHVICDASTLNGSKIIRTFASRTHFLPLDQAIASRVVFVIVSGSDGRADGRAETLLESAK